MDDMSKNIQELTSTQRALFELMLVEKQRSKELSRILPATRNQENHSCALSFAQQRIWLLYLLEPDNPSYNVPFAKRIRGSLDVAALERSLSEITRRHETLRTTFRREEGQLVQIISPPGPVNLVIEDLSALPLSRREAEVARLAAEEARQPFDLSQEPSLRKRLLRLSNDDHVFLLTMHHIICDAWSMSVFTEELGILYHAFSTGRSSPLPELPIQYADYAVWQRQWFQGEALERQLTYWKKQLDGMRAALELPSKRRRTGAQSSGGVMEKFLLPKGLGDGLKALGRQEGATLFMVLLAGFQVLLSRYSRQEDILVGSPTAGRNRSELEGLIGLFVNLLALRTDLSGDPSFRRLLQRVNAVTVGAYSHQDLPFEKLVEELIPHRTRIRQPIFQVLFALQNAPQTNFEIPGLSMTSIHSDSGTAKFDLSIYMAESANDLTGTLEYSLDLFEAATISRMKAHFRTLLEGVVANPDRRLSEVSLLTETERHQMLVTWNDTRGEYPPRLVVELIEDQAFQRPDEIAVSFEERQLSYGELSRKSNQLARHLHNLGVGPEVRVGVCIERSLDVVVGLLGILKAGGAYVPLDPAYPKDRLGWMLQDSGSAVLLTQSHLIDLLPELPVEVVCLDTDWDKIGRENPEIPAIEAALDNAAYLIYTSGSTGRPKGVQISHRALVNFLRSMQRQLELTDKDVMLAVTSLSFDIAALELYLPLTVGARLEVVGGKTVSDSRQLRKWLAASGATVMQATPVTWLFLIGAGWLSGDYMKILCGGEVLSRDLANQLVGRGASVWNLYGPTETTIWSTSYEVKPGDGPVSIGYPIDNTQVYLLDAYLQPVPVGTPGDLHIGGAGVARGYLNQPALTGEKFIPHHSSEEAGARLYRVGDLAVYKPDGSIEFLGRVDDQVKIRGHRIELGEIESALVEHPWVRQAAVAANEISPGNKQLTAYVVLKLGRIASIDVLRNFLREKLPDYLIPSAFVTLNALPLTPNGKVDRRALAGAEGIHFSAKTAYTPPQTGMEQAIVEIWREALGLDKIGVNDNFFDLGGHSLLMSEVFNKLQQLMSRELSMIELFEHPTVRALAEYLSRGEEGRESSTQGDDGLSGLKANRRRRQTQLKRRQSWRSERA